MEAEKDTVTRHDLRHGRHTVFLLTDYQVFSPKYRRKILEGAVAEAAEENLSLVKKALPKKHVFPQLKGWRPGHLWAPSCYHGSGGQGGEVVERYTSGQKNYYKNEDAVPVVVTDAEKEKTHKTNYISLRTKFFAVTGPVLEYRVCDWNMGDVHPKQKNHGFKNPRCTGICPLRRVLW